MKTKWDYTDLADAYMERPDYVPEVLNRLFQIANLKPGDRVCDLGAGVAHLAIPLARHGCLVDAVEPNDAMRANGKKRTARLSNIKWHVGTGEESGRPGGEYDFVTFGSSFNVCDQAKAMQETWRLLKPGKYFTCLWNHRDLKDPIQAKIEEIIKRHIPDYEYGVRRADQTEIINQSGLFENPQKVEGQIYWPQKVEDCVKAWRSHSTLHRQAGGRFDAIIAEIASYLHSLNTDEIKIPYTTRAWIARRRD